MSNVNWRKIKNEYITTDISQRRLAEKYKVSFNTLCCRARKEEWKRQKDDVQYRINTESIQKIEETIVKKEVDRISRILDLADKLSDKVEQAIDELDVYLAKNRKKTRVVEYKDLSAQGKPTKEIVEEYEEIVEVHTSIDRLGLQQVANALKSIKDIEVSLSSSGPAQMDDDGLIEALSATVDEEMTDDSDFLPEVDE